MTNEENAIMTCHLATDDFFDEKKDVVASIPAFKNVVEEFKANYQIEKQLSVILATNRTSYFKQKQILKAKMIDECVSLVGYAFVALNKAGKTSDANQLNIYPTDYKLGDNEAYNLAKANLKLLNSHTDIILPDYVTADNLTQLEDTIEAFINLKGQNQAIYKITPAQRIAFKEALNKTHKNIADIRLLAKKFIKTHALFYNELINITTVVLTNINHTFLVVQVTNKDGKPITDAICSLSKSKKTGISDLEGYLKINRILNGNMIITITATGYKDKIQQLKIVRGKENRVEVVLESEEA